MPKTIASLEPPSERTIKSAERQPRCKECRHRANPAPWSTPVIVLAMLDQKMPSLQPPGTPSRRLSAVGVRRDQRTASPEIEPIWTTAQPSITDLCQRGYSRHLHIVQMSCWPPSMSYVAPVSAVLLM